jgi:hypothetical protein
MAIVHASQLTPNGDWSPTSLLTAANASAMAAAQNEDGRIEIFYVDVLARSRHPLSGRRLSCLGDKGIKARIAVKRLQVGI